MGIRTTNPDHWINKLQDSIKLREKTELKPEPKPEPKLLPKVVRTRLAWPNVKIR